LNGVRLTNEQDVSFWEWPPKKVFTVKLVYDHLSRDKVGVSFSRIWRSKLPKKIKIFMWLFEQKAIHTKDNMIR
jgi:hypothetical protein